MRATVRTGVGALVLAGALALSGNPVQAEPLHHRADAWAGPMPLLAARRGSHGADRPREGLGPGEAAAIAREHAGGRVLRVRPRRPGAEAYQVKILLPGGRVRTVVVDGRTGEVLE